MRVRVRVRVRVRIYIYIYIYILEQLVRDVLSYDQYQKLVYLEELDLPTVVETVKETKNEQGLKFFTKNDWSIDSTKRIVSCLGRTPLTEKYFSPTI